MSDLKVALLYGGITQCGFNSHGLGDEGSWISHGLCSISAYAKKEGYEIELIDLRTLSGWKEYEELLLEKDYDVIGATMMSVDYQPVMQALSITKKVNSKIITILGGPHPSIMSEDCLKSKDVDVIVKGEGEITFTELIKKIEAGKKPEGIIMGKQPDLNAIPLEDRELFSGFEEPIADSEPPFVTIIAGRGCMYNCNFCQPAERMIFGRKVRRRSVENVIAELEMLRRKYQFRSLMIHDDCLTEDTNWVMEFCKAYVKHGFAQPFVCQSRADLVCKREEMIKLMAQVGLRLMIVGFESGNQRILNFLRKGTKVEHNYRATEILRKYKVKIWANYMLGVPTETKEEVLDTVEMILKIRPDHCSPAFFTPHPGSDLFEYCLENDLSLIKDHDSYRRNPTEPKIKDIDYSFLNKALMLSMGDLSFLEEMKDFVGLERYKELKKAKREYERMKPSEAKDTDKCKSVFQRGIILLYQGEYEKSMERFKKVLALKPKDKFLEILAHYNLGSIYKIKKDPEKAGEEFNIVISLASNYTKFMGGAYFHLGKIYEDTGEKQKAKKMFANCLKLIPEHQKAAKAIENLS